MATTTTNFGWDIPQSTDLVKDGATAIAALGQDIDTALVDLKGGTTGQILAKASNTDLDYSWITNDVGDITAVTAGTGITGGGTSGAVTVSFDQANFGGGQWAAGKNKIINGDFGIWQRGTSFTLANSTNTFTADRMRVNAQFTGTAATVTQQTFTAGTAPVSGYEGQYFLRYTAGGTTAPYFDLFQPIEDVRTFAGQTVTLSFWAKASVAIGITSALQQQFGSGGSSPVTITGSASTITTSWARYSFTIACTSVSGKTIGTGNNLIAGFYAGSHTASQTIDIWGLQIEAASTASNFQTATGTKQGELAACQRYYYVAASGNNLAVGTGANYSATNAYFTIALPVTMRINTATLVSSTGTDYYAFDRNGAADTFNSLNLAYIGPNAAIVYNNSEISGTAGQAGTFRTNNASASIALNAEL